MKRNKEFAIEMQRIKEIKQFLKIFTSDRNNAIHPAYCLKPMLRPSGCVPSEKLVIKPLETLEFVVQQINNHLDGLLDSFECLEEEYAERNNELGVENGKRHSNHCS